jgi:hypothetical protein
VPSKGQVDAGFWDRADAYIHLANRQCDEVAAGRVSASFLYAASRFNAFVVASGMASRAALEAAKADTLDYFTGEFRKMLEDNLDDHIRNFDNYTRRSPTADA